VKFDVKNTLFLIDGSSFLYRAYYGLKPMHTPAGIPVQAVFSFCRMIKKLVDTYTPQHMVLVWDSKGKTTRHAIFPEYKATRQAPPSDLFEQKKYIVEFAELIQLHQVEKPGIEADDLMYSLAVEWLENKQEEKTVVFITLDKDMGQALTLGKNVYLLDAFKEIIFDRAAIEEKNSFPVEQLPLYFALLGDASDNIPGVKGIGKKTAEDLVKQFDSLQDMYDHLDEIKKPGVKTALLTYKDNAFLSYDLFLLQYNAVQLTQKELAFDGSQWNNARPLFEALNFKSLLATAGHTKQEQVQNVQAKIDFWKIRSLITIATEQQLDELCSYLKTKGVFAVDTETTGVRALEVSLVGISFCADNEKAYYIPCGHQTDEVQLPREYVLAQLKPLLEDAQYKKYLHNTKYDQLVLSSHGIELQGIVLDTLIAANLIVKEWQSASLKNLSHYFFNEEMLTYDDVVKTHKYKDFSYVPLSLATLYAAADALQTFKLVAVLQEAFKTEPTLKKLYDIIEHPLMHVLYAMEKRGIYLDITHLSELDKQVVNDLTGIEKHIGELVEEKTINLSSPKQVENLLFYVLKLPPQKKSPKGAFSTDYEVLKVLAELHPVPALIIKHRELIKLKNTYIDALPGYVNKKTNHIHTTFSQTTAATGRLASSHPNLQNIPADSSGYGIEVRAAFEAEQGTLFVSADYSQIELRVLAYLSQDKNLIEAFLKGHDIHTETAARLFDVALEQVTNEQRQLGKRINFSILYGLTPYGLSKDLNISFKDAKKYIDRYFEQYPQVSAWMKSVLESTTKHGYVETLWGRRRYIPAIHEKNRNLYEEACRIAINTVAQGTAAEIMKLGMIAVDGKLQAHYKNAAILLQIHDELIVSAPQEQVIEIEKMLKVTLESVVQWNVPLVVETCSGRNWKEVT
jgi:DNA polymerase-1